MSPSTDSELGNHEPGVSMQSRDAVPAGVVSEDGLMPAAQKLISVLSGRRDGLVDAGLVERVAARDEKALVELYQKYRKPVFTLSLRILRDEHEAEEMLQEVFLHIWDKAALFNRERGSFESWLLTLTHHKAIDALRTKRFKQRLAEDRMDPDELARIANEQTILTRTALVESAENDERKHVQRALESIPTEQKQVLELAYYDGYSQTEISELLELPLGTVKTRMRQGMIKLSRSLEYLRYSGD